VIGCRGEFGCTARGAFASFWRMMCKHSSDWRRLGRVLLVGLATIAGPFSNCAQPGYVLHPAERKPSIIFILADDLGYGDLGCYGQTKIKTPNLDKMAAEGMRFTSFYAGSTVCAPSRCALMTGLHTGHALIRGNALVPLRPQDLTVAELLQQAGYHTSLIGKWGLGNPNTTGVPQKKGFDEFLGYLDQVHAHDYYTDYLWRYDPHADAKPGYDGRVEFAENRDGKKGRYMDDLFDEAALRFVSINKPESLNHFRPFFLYLSYTIPHANNEEGQRTGNGMEVPSDAPYSNEAWPPTERNKAAMITRLDTYVGQLLDKLKGLKIDDSTVIFFTSDNGPHKEGGVDPEFFHSGGLLRGIKRDLYEGGIRVPLIVRWPGEIKPGTANDQPWAFWDFLPTAAEIAGVKVPEKIDGISLLPTLLGRPQTNRHDFLYWEFHEGGSQQAVRMGDWKAVRLGPGAPLELYNLSSDLGEKQNVAAQNPEVVAKIEAYLKTARTESERWPIKAAQAAPAKKQ
jgi:arylsulfatase A-like enzyme